MIFASRRAPQAVGWASRQVGFFFLVLAVLAGAFSGCAVSSELFIDLRTDYIAGVEVARVELVLNGDPEPDTELLVGADLLTGIRIASISGIADGAHQFEARLLSADGTLLGSRQVAVEVSGPTGVTVIISRNCAMVTCPGSGSAAATECLNSMCVPPGCTPETPEACEDAFCEVDSDCAVSTSSCSRARCGEGACFDETVPGICEDTESCTAEGCVVRMPCVGPEGCASGVCREGRCSDAECDDGVRNGDETGADCGGSCTGCPEGGGCSEAADCLSGVCDGLVCLAPACDDGVMNGDETGVDCGGPGECTRCSDLDPCLVGSDCSSTVCHPTELVCVAAACVDGVMNGEETDVDCGGPACTACDTGGACTTPSDCLSMRCEGMACAAPACDDGLRNGDETDVDCGGESGCPRCAVGLGCAAETDCGSGVCTADVCEAATCEDAVMNGDETDVDCGGTCLPCADGAGCGTGTDCVSSVCGGGACAAARCDDGVQNGAESDVDCGGGSCPGCGAGLSCGMDADCSASLFCSGEQCRPRCGNGALDAGETCDDGNTTNGDGCSASCTVQTGASCVGAPSVCRFESCRTILVAGGARGNGIYTIDPDGSGGRGPVNVFCDMADGGWTWIVGHSSYASGNFPGATRTVTGIGISFASGQISTTQGTSAAGSCFVAQPTILVDVNVPHTTMNVQGSVTWRNSTAAAYMDLGINGSREWNWSQVCPGTGCVNTVNHNQTRSVGTRTTRGRAYLAGNSCQRTGLARMTLLRVR